ncbi:MAG: threonine ammonia-lyase [Pseudomonadota bacterium]
MKTAITPNAAIPPQVETALKQTWAWHEAGLEAIVHTPFIHADRISEALDCELWIKLENLQHTGSFKERGALVKLLSLSDKERAVGVVAASAGNHAQGLARHAGRLGIQATLVMPVGTPVVKARQTEELGAKVVLHGEAFDDAQAHAEHLVEAEGLTLIHPFDDPFVIAGQSTLAREILMQSPRFDALIAPIGGGGLMAGAALAARELAPHMELIGVQAELFPTMANALDGAQRAVGGNTLAEGIAVKRPGALTRQIIGALVDDIVLVGEPALERAVNMYLNKSKTLAEGAGAAGLAAILSDRERFRGKRVATMVCGGNIDTRLLSSLLLRDLARSGRMARLRIELIDVPGQLVRVSEVIAETQGNVIDVAYHRIFSDLPAKVTYIDISVEAHDGPHMERILAALRKKGFKVETAGY